MRVLYALSFSHLLNDTIQSLLPAIYPIIKNSFALTFTQIGLITLTFQIIGSVLQPVIGRYTDRHPLPYSLAAGMCFSLLGLVLLSYSTTFGMILVSSGLIGVGSSVFHPEASRVARLASGGKHGFAQSLFQVGGNFGSALGPLGAAIVIVPHGQRSILWFSLFALLGIAILYQVGGWYKKRVSEAPHPTTRQSARPVRLPRIKIVAALAILVALIFSKYFYLVSLSNYYTFYLIDKFHVPVSTSQIYLFVFLFAVAAGTILGGLAGDRFGRKYVIWISILGVAPFSIALPYLSLPATILFSVLIGLILASAFSAILVYAQELIPGKVGTISGLFFGLAFGMGGISSAALGHLIDHTSIDYVFKIAGYLPLIGLLTAFLPDVEHSRPADN